MNARLRVLTIASLSALQPSPPPSGVVSEVPNDLLAPSGSLRVPHPVTGARGASLLVCYFL